MKKVLILLLSLMLVFAFAACGAEEEQPEAPVSDTDLNIIETEEESNVHEVEGELSQLEEVIGTTITLPESFVVTRYAVVNDNIAQVEFEYDELKFVGRYATGNQSNMSGLTREFTNNETVDVEGVSVQLRYNVYAEDDLSAQGASATMGIADAYNSTDDMSFMIYAVKGADKDNLTEAMTAFMDAVKIGAVEEEAAAE